jgi:hypothetical protein
MDLKTALPTLALILVIAETHSRPLPETTPNPDPGFTFFLILNSYHLDINLG